MRCLNCLPFPDEPANQQIRPPLAGELGTPDAGSTGATRRLCGMTFSELLSLLLFFRRAAAVNIALVYEVDTAFPAGST